MEINWTPIKNYEDSYEICHEGFVRNKRTKKVLCASTVGCKYPYVILFHKEKGIINKKVYVHRLMAETFIPNPDNKPHIDHIDRDKNNCKVSNLRWVTPSENMGNAWIGSGIRCRLTRCGQHRYWGEFVKGEYRYRTEVFNTEEEAKQAYRAAHKQIYADYSKYA